MVHPSMIIILVSLYPYLFYSLLKIYTHLKIVFMLNLFENVQEFHDDFLGQ